jgi:hypothetical protein
LNPYESPKEKSRDGANVTAQVLLRLFGCACWLAAAVWLWMYFRIMSQSEWAERRATQSGRFWAFSAGIVLLPVLVAALVGVASWRQSWRFGLGAFTMLLLNVAYVIWMASNWNHF